MTETPLQRLAIALVRLQQIEFRTRVLIAEADEALTDNNAQQFRIAVRSETLKVLVVDSLPRWEYRYLRNALERDPGVQVDCLLIHPDLGKPGSGRGYLGSFPKPDELAKYHVVFLGVGVATGLEANPPLVAIPGVGVLIRDDAKPAIEPMGRCLADVMRRVEEHDPLVALTDEDVDRLVNWDAEKYRQTLKV